MDVSCYSPSESWMSDNAGGIALRRPRDRLSRVKDVGALSRPGRGAAVLRSRAVFRTTHLWEPGSTRCYCTVRGKAQPPWAYCEIFGDIGVPLISKEVRDSSEPNPDKIRNKRKLLGIYSTLSHHHFWKIPTSATFFIKNKTFYKRDNSSKINK